MDESFLYTKESYLFSQAHTMYLFFSAGGVDRWNELLAEKIVMATSVSDFKINLK